jgi:hypothetical protein
MTNLTGSPWHCALLNTRATGTRICANCLKGRLLRQVLVLAWSTQSPLPVRYTLCIYEVSYTEGPVKFAGKAVDVTSGFVTSSSTPLPVRYPHCVCMAYLTGRGVYTQLTPLALVLGSHSCQPTGYLHCPGYKTRRRAWAVSRENCSAIEGNANLIWHPHLAVSLHFLYSTQATQRCNYLAPCTIYRRMTVSGRHAFQEGKVRSLTASERAIGIKTPGMVLSHPLRVKTASAEYASYMVSTQSARQQERVAVLQKYRQQCTANIGNPVTCDQVPRYQRVIHAVCPSCLAIGHHLPRDNRTVWFTKCGLPRRL